MQLLANVGLLATRWRQRTRSDIANSRKKSSRSSGPWATVSRTRRASSPTQGWDSLSRSSSPNTIPRHIDSHSDTAISDSTSSRAPFNRTQASATAPRISGASMHTSHALSHVSDVNTPRTQPDKDSGKDSSFYSSVSSAAPPGTLTSSLAQRKEDIRAGIATDGSGAGANNHHSALYFA